MIETGNLSSFILWGPPGVGKTTLSRIVATSLKREFFTLSAVSAGVKDVRDVIDRARSNSLFSGGLAPILFIDEIHRFNKSQQDALLGAVEDGTVILIGATTENPSFEVITPLLSRCQVFVLKSLGQDDLNELLHRALKEDVILRHKSVQVVETDALFRHSAGDARKLLNILDIVTGAAGNNDIVIDAVKQAQDGNGIIVRVYQSRRVRGERTLTINLPFSKAYECNLMEVDEKEISADGNKLKFNVTPFEVKTFRLV
jgi:putative ATPase